MSYANGTTHYNLPQTVSTDKRDWTDTNQAFADVDAALYTASETASTAASNISTLDGQINTPSTGLAAQLAAAQEDITSLDGRMDTAEGTITQHTTDISDVRGDLEDAIVAFNEPTATSTHAYGTGENDNHWFFYNDILYKATDAIAIGDTIVPNTNCKATNVMTEVDEINTALSGGEKTGHTYFYLTYSANVVTLISKGTAPSLVSGQWTDIGQVDPSMKPAYLIRGVCSLGSNYEVGRIRIKADDGVVSIYNPTASDLSSCDFCLSYAKGN